MMVEERRRRLRSDCVRTRATGCRVHARCAPGVGAGRNPAVIGREASPKGRRLDVFVLLLFAFIRIPLRSHANESAKNAWIDKRVVPKGVDVLRRDKQERLGEKHFVRILASGIFRVEKADGKDLLLRAEGHEFRAWASSEQVVPLEGAIEYFTGRI
jgi:hypothetical protein